MTATLQWRDTELATKSGVCFTVISAARQRRLRDAELLNRIVANFCLVAKYK
jgi:hypothetical protein